MSDEQKNPEAPNKAPQGRHENSLRALREHGIPKGQTRNPGGRRSIGMTIREWMNQMRKWKAKDIRKVFGDEEEPIAKRAAANQLLHMIEDPDIADFEPYLEGKKTLEDLRKAGVKTNMARKAKISDKGVREIELRERAGQSIDRVLDQTAGKPIQPVDHTSDGQPIKAFIGVDIDQV